jgi:hypothetical protein
MRKTPTIVAPTARPIGEGGVSVISSAAGKKAISWALRVTAFGLGNKTIF